GKAVRSELPGDLTIDGKFVGGDQPQDPEESQEETEWVNTPDEDHVAPPGDRRATARGTSRRSAGGAHPGGPSRRGPASPRRPLWPGALRDDGQPTPRALRHVRVVSRRVLAVVPVRRGGGSRVVDRRGVHGCRGRRIDRRRQERRRG